MKNRQLLLPVGLAGFPFCYDAISAFVARFYALTNPSEYLANTPNQRWDTVPNQCIGQTQQTSDSKQHQENYNPGHVSTPYC